MDSFTSAPPTAADNVPIKVMHTWITANVLSGRILKAINFFAAALPFEAMSRKNGILDEAKAISIQENRPLKRSNTMIIIHSIVFNTK